jgi:hypothetical protein
MGHDLAGCSGPPLRAQVVQGVAPRDVQVLAHLRQVLVGPHVGERPAVGLLQGLDPLCHVLTTSLGAVLLAVGHDHDHGAGVGLGRRAGWRLPRFSQLFAELVQVAYDGVVHGGRAVGLVALSRQRLDLLDVLPPEDLLLLPRSMEGRQGDTDLLPPRCLLDGLDLLVEVRDRFVLAQLHRATLVEQDQEVRLFLRAPWDPGLLVNRLSLRHLFSFTKPVPVFACRVPTPLRPS